MLRESAILKYCRLAAAKLRMTLFRNNTGALKTDDGRWVNFGLCKGSSDLIGWNTVIIREHMVGRKIAVFTAIETKSYKGRVSKEQANFLSELMLAGGLAILARESGDVETALVEWMREGI